MLRGWKSTIRLRWISFSPLRIDDSTTLPSHSSPLLSSPPLFQHLERIIRIIKFNRHGDIGIVHAFSCLSSGFLFVGEALRFHLGRDVYRDSEKCGYDRTIWIEIFCSLWDCSQLFFTKELLNCYTVFWINL